MNAPPLILASASARRRDLLGRVGVPIEIRPADIDETPLPDEDPAAYVTRIARGKADAIERPPGRFVLAADTTVTVAGLILAKAESDEEAAGMVRALEGKTHQVITAFCIAGDFGRHEERVTTDVDFIALDDETIAAYVASGEYRGKAGAYAIQGIASAFVLGLRGSVTNVIGLPLAEVLAALSEVGAPSAQIAKGIPV